MPARLAVARSLFAFAVLAHGAADLPALAQEPTAARSQETDSGVPPVDYSRDIQPLMFHKCAACHGALQQRAGLRLDAGKLIRQGGDSGPAVQPGDGAASLLVERVSETDPDLRMPPAGEGEALTTEQIRLIRRWIDDGAESPADEAAPEDPAQYWSYQPVLRPPVPKTEAGSWARNEIDAFIAAEHARIAVVPRAEAARPVWLRRVYLDLIGLPPTRQDLHAFLSDHSPQAYERVVDSLLQRPEYGERWGRHWMDVWRYSDWYGNRGSNEIRYSQRHIWRWRDWIIESLIQDKPYDRMLVEMLAGDELAPADPDVLRATGYLGRNWYKFDRNVWMFETVEHTSQAFLGLTLRCARCHDHKFDPIAQQDYYRFRAFFEPHGVRTDALSADPPQEKDATLGTVLADGVARVFDQDLTATTFLFERGDDRNPDKSRPLTPGVPPALGGEDLQIEPIALPPAAFYPSLRPEIAEGMVASALAAVESAEHLLAEARHEQVRAAEALARFKLGLHLGQGSPADAATSILHDNFDSRSDYWQPVSGDWSWQGGKLIENSIGNFSTLVTTVEHPRDFQATVRYRTLQPGTYRSVGFSFDYVDQGNSQDVYTSTNDSSPTVQAFHRIGGKQEYPQAGILPTPLAVGEVVSVEAKVRGQQLSISVNGAPKLDYQMPVARRAGRFALWVHQGAAEFLEVELQRLPLSELDLERDQRRASQHVAMADGQLQIAKAKAAAVRARVAAEREKYLGRNGEAGRNNAVAADRAERTVEVAEAELAVLRAAQHRAAVVGNSLTPEPVNGQPESTGNPAAMVEAEKQVAEAQEALAAAQAALTTLDGEYAPLGDVFPATSTGRRLALARWMVRPTNPRTARVAVNHIWLRHFGQALVPTVANFGIHGQRPSHPQLLDWLAAELMENGWRMKPLHRQMVLSATYRQSSAADGDSLALARDPENRFLWRMNSRRMEAEVVRDSLLFTAGVLDQTHGGPEIPEGLGQISLRRSLYFRNTPNETMAFLESFDAPNPNECYRRHESVVPHQALALMNSSLALDQARVLARQLTSGQLAHGDPPLSPLMPGAAADAVAGQPSDRAIHSLSSQTRPAEDDDELARTEFITAAIETVLSRQPTPQELAACLRFLSMNRQLLENSDSAAFPATAQEFRLAPAESPEQRARENLIHVLYSHNDFVTVR